MSSSAPATSAWAAASSAAVRSASAWPWASWARATRAAGAGAAPATTGVPARSPATAAATMTARRGARERLRGDAAQRTTVFRRCRVAKATVLPSSRPPTELADGFGPDGALPACAARAHAGLTPGVRWVPGPPRPRVGTSAVRRGRAEAPGSRGAEPGRAVGEPTRIRASGHDRVTEPGCRLALGAPPPLRGVSARPRSGDRWCGRDARDDQHERRNDADSRPDRPAHPASAVMSPTGPPDRGAVDVVRASSTALGAGGGSRVTARPGADRSGPGATPRVVSGRPARSAGPDGGRTRVSARRTVAAAVGVAAVAGAAVALSQYVPPNERGRGAVAAGDLNGSLVGAGASSQQAAIQGWTAGYSAVQPGITVDYDPVGSGGGREQFVAGGIDFAGSDAPLDEEELVAARQRCGGEVFELPNYISPIAVVHNLPGVEDLALSPTTLSRVFAAVAGGEGTVGYADLSQAGDLGVARIGVGGEFVPPTPEAAAAVVEGSEPLPGRGPYDFALELERTTAESGSYPIVLVSYHLGCIAYEDPLTANLVADFMTYVTSEEGQAAAAEVAGSAPISDALRDQARTAIDAIGTAS